MRLFAAVLPSDPTPRAAGPSELLRRLAFGRPARRPAPDPAPRAVQAAGAIDSGADRRPDCGDLDQRVRESGEW